MKKMALLSGIIVSASLFTGCTYKTECGVDGCGRHYVDRTYRTYPKAIDCKNECNKNTLQIHSKCNPCIKKAVIKRQVPTVCATPEVVAPVLPAHTPVLKYNKILRIDVIGQGVAPSSTTSPAQAYALAKRAAIADAYRLIAEKIKGVYVEGDDLVKNMMVKRSTVRTSVNAMVRNANVMETTFKEGLCEVQMEIKLSHSQFTR